MKPIRSSKFDKAVIHIEVLNNKYLLVVDAQTTIRYLDIETLEIKNQLKANAIQTSFVNNSVAFSSNCNYFALIGSGAKDSKLYNTKTKKLVASVNRHQGDVSCVAIDPKNRYMFSCGEDGLTFGVDIKSGQLAFTLPRHVDTVNDIAFSKNGGWAATGSYDKSIVLFNLTTMTPRDRLKAHSAPVLKVIFLNKNRLLSIDSKGGAIVWNIANLKIVTRLQSIHDDVTKIVTGVDEAFLFIGTKLGYVIIYDLKSYEQITMKYIKLNSPISAMGFDEVNKNLLIGTQDGDLLIYDIFQDQNAIYEALTYKKYSLVQGLIDNNPLLIYTDAYVTFNTLWEKTLERAKEFMENGDKQKATKLFENFMEIPSKRQAMQKLFEKYQDYDKFLLLVKQNRLPLAYGLAKSNPVFKETKAYSFIELQWRKSVALAQKYLLNPNNEDKVKEIFAPYRGIPEKTVIIQDIFLNAMVYNRFKISMINKNFKIVLEYVKKYPFLKESAEYATLIRYSDSLYIKAQEFQKNGDTHSAIKMYRMLLDFDDFKEEAKEMIAEIENQHKFFNVLKENDIATAYNILDSSFELQSSQDGIRLEQIWESDYEKASEAAARSDVDSVKNILNKYITIKSKHMAIGTLISWCYITELNRAIRGKIDQKTIENGIKNYVLYFGLSDQIVTFFDLFCKEYPETKLNLESQVKGSIESWRPSMIIKSILDLPLTCSIA
jgi:WD40 repeat protein